MNDKAIKEQLDALRAATVRVGVIHEAQALQLKMWPMLIPGVKFAECHVDPSRKLVHFKCKADKFRKTKKTINTLQNIESWVKQLLWPDSVVVFNVNENQVIYSKDKDE